jgi:hypothetical protein
MTWHLAEADLRKIEKGLVDPQGKRQIEDACSISLLGLSASALYIGSGMLVWLLFSHR